MLDFMSVSVEQDKKGVVCIAPEFNMETGPELLIQGGDFLAIYNDGLWSKSELTAFKLMDKKLNEYAKKYREEHPETPTRVRSLMKAKSGAVDEWHKYVKNQLRDTDPCPQLDSKIIFSNMTPTLEDYATKVMKYPLSESPTPAYDKMSHTLYTDEELRKLEYCIGAVVSGESKNLQKFAVLYGPPGSGKSTMIDIIQQLFDGHCCVFDAKTVGGKGSFPLESFRNNPLVAIQHDGDLSEVEDNTTINSLVSHEVMPMNVKNKSVYPMRINSFIFMGTNKPVRITDAKSGLIRRLIDISPSGEKLDIHEYSKLKKQIEFELGGIAYHCLKVFEEDPHYYDNYIATSMVSATNDFYNYILYYYLDFKQDDSTTLKIAWENYRKYCEYANVTKCLKYSEFREELKSYFRVYKERDVTADGTRVRSLYSGFIEDKFENKEQKKPSVKKHKMSFNCKKSLFDDEFADCPAQYATKEGTPIQKWAEVGLKLSDIQTNMLHYVKVPENLIVIDFDIKDEDGNKSLERNIEEASKWPLTYAELSKSGAGIHLHYYYDGDPTKLSRVYGDNIEIKVFTGNSSLRRMLTKCNDIPIATISSGLPIAEKKSMVNFEGLKNEKALRTCIIQNLQKKNAPGTKPSIDFIFNNLEDAYNSGMKYDVSDMKHDIYVFAASSSHHADYCLKKVTQMKFKSEEASESVDTDFDDDNIYFFDVEVFINLFVVVYKKLGGPPVELINPDPDTIADLLKLKLIGFNCRRYDNHILYARTLGYTNEQLYKLSQRIVNGSSNCFFSEAYNLSYTDIYDFTTKKQSLKKYEIELWIEEMREKMKNHEEPQIHHHELGLKWDEPVPENLWKTVADYCIDDVIATEKTFLSRKGDWTARKILVAVCRSMGLNACLNDTTNSLTTKIIFGKEKHPTLVYTDLATGRQY